MRRTTPVEPAEPVEPIEPIEPAEPFSQTIKGRPVHGLTLNPIYQRSIPWTKIHFASSSSPV